MKVFLTDPNYKHTLAAGRYLAREGVTVYIPGGKRTLCGRSKHFQALDLEEDPFSGEIENLISVFEREKLDVIIPIGARSVSKVSENFEALSKTIQFVIPTAQQLEVAFSKQKTAEVARRIGIRTPLSIEPLLESDWREELLKWDVSGYVIKGSSELSKVEVLYFDEREDLFQWASREPAQVKSIVIQERVYGQGSGYFALYGEDGIQAEFMHRRVRELPPSGGASCCCESVESATIREAGRKLLESLNWVGPAMVEFKVDKKTGEPVLLEINPKFWGSMELALWCGVNFPYETARLALKQPNLEFPKYPSGKRFHWIVPEIEHLLRKPSSLGGILKDSLSHSVGGNVWLSDLTPSFMEASMLGKRLFRRLLRKSL